MYFWICNYSNALVNFALLEQITWRRLFLQMKELCLVQGFGGSRVWHWSLSSGSGPLESVKSWWYVYEKREFTWWDRKPYRLRSHSPFRRHAHNWPKSFALKKKNSLKKLHCVCPCMYKGECMYGCAGTKGDQKRVPDLPCPLQSWSYRWLSTVCHGCKE